MYTRFVVVAALCASLGLQAAELEVSQKSKLFVLNEAPVRTLSVKLGDSISFRNEDPFFHNVFSASKAKDFDLGSYPEGQTRKVVFDKVGGVDVECAIHPGMKLHVEVQK